MTTHLSRKEARTKIRQSILKATEEISVSPASRRLKKAVKDASKKIGKELSKDLKRLARKASKITRKASKLAKGKKGKSVDAAAA